MKALAVIGILLAIVAIAAGWGYRSQRRELQDLEARLLRRPLPDFPVETRSDDAPLPAPVARYLQLALGENRTHPETVEIHQSGELRTDEMSERWMPFTATHLATPRGCGFIWNARIRLAPLMHLRVLDSLVDGQGAGQAILQSVLKVAEETNSPQMNSGALHRFLAEAVWYPWALAPSQALRWTAIDDQRALATLTCGKTTVSLEFRFLEDGTVAGIYTPARWGRFAGRYEQVPWEGRFSDYQRQSGILIPSKGEVGWYRDGQLRTVWRGTVRSARHQRRNDRDRRSETARKRRISAQSRRVGWRGTRAVVLRSD